MIYVVEDNSDIREIVKVTLESAGYEVMDFEESRPMLDAMERRLPELILLDIMLPGMDGMETLKIIEANKRYEGIPIIMLTAKSGELDKVQFLNSGAYDYITKPFGVLELIARVKANIRRNSNKELKDNTLYIGDFSINDNKRRICYKNEEITLTKKEYELTKLLIINHDKVLSKEDILTKVWGEDFEGEARTLNMFIARLREKLSPVVIKTVKGIGFVLIL